MLTPMTTQLESLRKHSVVVADTGDIDAVARWKPQDATTNPSLLLASAADPRYRPLLERSMAQAKRACSTLSPHSDGAIRSRLRAEKYGTAIVAYRSLWSITS